MTVSPFLNEVFEAAPQLGKGAALFDAVNPATQEVIARVSDMAEDAVDPMVQKAKSAMKAWAALTANQRTDHMLKWRDAILDRQEDLARLITLEMGKPTAEAMGEVAYGASYITWFAEEGKRLYGDIVPTNAEGRRILVIKQPVGVTAAITPWNFPNAMITRKLAPALAAGCACLIKPAEDTPLSAVALLLLARRAGLPDGLINLITCRSPGAVARRMIDHPDVRKLSFTGSTAVGKLLMRQCADTVTKISLELGGNAPFIVFDDADLDAAAQGAFVSRYRNAGQTCVSANRIFVQRSVSDQFIGKLKKHVAELRIGYGGDANMGPLVNVEAARNVRSLLHGAIAEGADLVWGEASEEDGSAFVSPVILDKVAMNMKIANAEIFGPVGSIIHFDTEEEAVEMANDTPYGLAAYFYTRDMARTWRVSEALEYGMVGVNEGIISSEAAPFGGVKESGIGREGSKYGLDDYTEIKYIRLAGL